VIDVQFSGEGIAAIVLAIGTVPTGLYTLWRQVIADRKLDRQQRALELVAANQTATKTALTDVVDVVKGVQVNVAKVEKATNSLKDALVKTTQEAYLLRGQAQGIAAEKARAGSSELAQPDGAPTAEQIEQARAAQLNAIAADAAARRSEATTIDKTTTSETPPRTNP